MKRVQTKTKKGQTGKLRQQPTQRRQHNTAQRDAKNEKLKHNTK